MSDEPARPGMSMGTPTGLFEHYCERDGCTAWGSYGYHARRMEPVHYFCHAHRDEGERILGR